MFKPANNLKNMMAATIPRQHGAWFSLFACFILGLIVAYRVDFKSFLLLISVVAGFLLRYSLSETIKAPRKFSLFIFPIIFYFIMLAASGLFLLFYYNLIMLIPLGVLPAISVLSYFYFEKIGKANSLSSEIMGMLGIAAVSPASYYVASGKFTAAAEGIWIVSALFFVCSIFVVRYLVRGKLWHKRMSEYIKSISSPFAFCLLSVAAAYFLGRFTNLLPRYTFISLVPSLFILVGLSVAKKKSSIKRIGLISTANVIIFVILSAVSFL